tara:strand:- start:1085 stop:1483 length:399 start_codon:yes stop_codon:yes gene_type:complete
MAGITERNAQRVELANSGFTMDYIDEWQPKTTLYRHKASLTVGGEISQGVGTAVRQVPGNPDYVLKKAKIGLFPWKPGSECSCQWCGETFKKDNEKPEVFQESCSICGVVVEAKAKPGLISKLKAHKSKTHP